MTASCFKPIKAGFKKYGRRIIMAGLQSGIKLNSAEDMYVRAGQDIVMCGYIGLKGTIYAAERCSNILLKTLSKDFVARAVKLNEYYKRVPEAAVAIQHGATAMHFVEDGGIFTALWQMAEKYDTGLTVYLKRIPVKQETIEICEIYDVNPYQLSSGGCVMYVCDNGFGLCEFLKDNGFNASIIGIVTDSNDRIILNGDGVRYINRPQPDEIYKFMEDV